MVPEDGFVQALDALHAAASATIDINQVLGDDADSPPSVLHALSRARTRDDAAPVLEVGAVGSARLLKAVVGALDTELAQIRKERAAAVSEVQSSDDLSDLGRTRRLAEIGEKFDAKVKDAIGEARPRAQQIADARERALLPGLTPPTEATAPDPIEVLGRKLDSMMLVMAASSADDHAFETFARGLIERGDARAPAVLEAAAAAGRDGLLLQRLAVVARTNARSQSRRAAEAWLTGDSKRLTDCAELKLIRKLKREAQFYIDAAARKPGEPVILPSHFEIK